jgi:hypothetical protein
MAWEESDSLRIKIRKHGPEWAASGLGDESSGSRKKAVFLYQLNNESLSLTLKPNRPPCQTSDVATAALNRRSGHSSVHVVCTGRSCYSN